MCIGDSYYPLGHIVTSLYWQQCEDGGLHFTISETGWAKSVWGKLYGQWLTGSAVFVYDFERFIARDILCLLYTSWEGVVTEEQAANDPQAFSQEEAAFWQGFSRSPIL